MNWSCYLRQIAYVKNDIFFLPQSFHYYLELGKNILQVCCENQHVFDVFLGVHYSKAFICPDCLASTIPSAFFFFYIDFIGVSLTYNVMSVSGV